MNAEIVQSAPFLVGKDRECCLNYWMLIVFTLKLHSELKQQMNIPKKFLHNENHLNRVFLLPHPRLLESSQV